MPPNKKTTHLICSAHIAPALLWEYPRQIIGDRSELNGSNKTEPAIQQWAATCDLGNNTSYAVINDVCDSVGCEPDKLNIRLLCSPTYPKLQIPDHPMSPTDRFRSRIDQDEQISNFWITGGKAAEDIDHIYTLASSCNKDAMPLSFFSSSEEDGSTPKAQTAHVLYSSKHTTEELQFHPFKLKNFRYYRDFQSRNPREEHRPDVYKRTMDS